MKQLILFIVFTFNVSAIFAMNDINEYVDPSENPYDESLDKPWQEDAVSQLPSANPSTLIQVDVDNPPIGFKIFLDESSLVVSESDQIIRYWIVLRAGKSRNSQYEGIKCNSREYKVYAYENKWDKTKVKLNPLAKWEFINIDGHNQFRDEMRRYFFCYDVLPRKKDEILRRIKGYEPAYKHDQYLN